MLANLMFPILCISCGKTWEYLCSDCKKKLQAHPEICPVCHNFSQDYRVCKSCSFSSPIQWLIIWFAYQSFLKKLIISLKYKHQKTVADFLVHRLSLVLQTNSVFNELTPENTIFTYVPSHWYRRYFIKWYNQSMILSKNLADIIGFPFADILKKIKHTKSQVKLNKTKRAENIRNKFILKENLSWEINLNKIKYIFIVDDITTTGSTIFELANVIKRKYPDMNIRWLVVGRHTG